jgi:hypothetical protein
VAVLALPDKFNSVNPFIRSIPARPPLDPSPVLGETGTSPEFPKTPNRSSKLLLVAGTLPVVGVATLTGVPAKPSRPDRPLDGSFCADAGADPSKSISRRFSTLFWACAGGSVPETAAAAAAAASGFSRAFCSCSLKES